MKKYIILGTALVLTVLLLIFFNTLEDNKSSIQKKQDRAYNISLVEIDSIKHSFSATDYLLSEDFIFLKNYQKQQIIQIDKKGKEIARYGSKGEGPKETLMIRGFDVDHNSYKTIDAGKNTITKISFNDSIIYSYKPSSVLSTGVFIANDKIITKGSKGEFGNEKIKFSLIDSNSESEINVDDIFEDKKNSNWIYDGVFSKTFDNGAIYATHFSNVFIRFNADGDILYKKNFIYDVPEIKLKEESGTLFPVANDNPNVYSFASNKDLIFFYTSIGDKVNRKGQIIVDAYSLSDGEYFGSFSIKKDKVHRFPIEIRVINNQLLLFYEDFIKITKLKY